MVPSATEKNKTGRRLCVRDIFTEKVISEPSYWRGYLGEKCGWTADQHVVLGGRAGLGCSRRLEFRESEREWEI